MKGAKLTWKDDLVAALLAALVMVVLVATVGDLGYARDEGFYFHAADSYRRWLSDNGVRWVAVPDADLDFSAYAERDLIDRGLPYLKLRARLTDWRVYEYTGPSSLVTPEGHARVRLTSLGIQVHGGMGYVEETGIAQRYRDVRGDREVGTRSAATTQQQFDGRPDACVDREHGNRQGRLAPHVERKATGHEHPHRRRHPQYIG